MEIHQIFYNTFSRRDYFEMKSGQRPWEVFLMITNGSFRYTMLGKEFVIEENEIAYFPINTPFQRQIITPISFHQFAFNTDPTHPYYSQLTPGKLNIPKKEVRRLAKSLESILLFPDRRALHSHYIEHMIVQNYIHRRRLDIAPTGHPEDIMTVIQYMNEHIDEKIDIDRLAELVHLSHVGLLWKFKQYTGQTLAHYLIMLRMSLAKQLLLENTQRINEIALRCGYTNPYYFSNAFREYYQVSPRRFREVMLNGERESSRSASDTSRSRESDETNGNGPSDVSR